MIEKKIPLRRCIGCNEMKEKRALVRVVKNKEGEVSLDLTGKKAGRGAYICNSHSCFLQARKVRGFERAFSQKIPDEVFERLESELKQNG